MRRKALIAIPAAMLAVATLGACSSSSEEAPATETEEEAVVEDAPAEGEMEEEVVEEAPAE